MNTKHSKSPSLHLYVVARGQLPQRAGLPGMNGGGTAAVVHPEGTKKTKEENTENTFYYSYVI